MTSSYNTPTIDNSAFTKISKTLESLKPQITLGAPKNFDANKFVRTLLTEVRRIPRLLDCTQESFLACMMMSAQIGLEIGGVLGHAYILPYKDKCTFILGYKGMIQLMYRSDRVSSINAQAVYENDVFDLSYGVEDTLVHKPTWGDKGKFLGAYCKINLTTGGTIIEGMSKTEIDKIRDRSPSAKKSYSPWVSDYEQMAIKTVIRRANKKAPMSLESEQAFAYEDNTFHNSPKFNGTEIVYDAKSEETKVDGKSIVEEVINGSSAGDEFFEEADKNKKGE